MITMTIDRDKPGDEFFPGQPRPVSPGSALAHMLRWDCGWNTKVREFTGSKLVLSREVGNCVDTTTYQGEPVELAILLRGFLYWLVLYGKSQYALQLYCTLFHDGTEAGWNFDPDPALFKGNASCHKGCILLGFNQQDPANIEYVTGRGWFLTDEQLCAVLDLVQETGLPAEQLVAELGPM